MLINKVAVQKLESHHLKVTIVKTDLGKLLYFLDCGKKYDIHIVSKYISTSVLFITSRKITNGQIRVVRPDDTGDCN
jgi:hypothetical protein